MSVGLDDIPRFIIKGCSVVLAPLLKNIFDISLSREHFTTKWKKSGYCAYFQKR
jgi:hypothetical protein